MSPALENLLSLCEERGASDIHLAADSRPRFRVRGALVELADLRAFDRKEVDAIAMEIGLYTLPTGCADGTERVRLTLARDGAIDGALTGLPA